MFPAMWIKLLICACVLELVHCQGWYRQNDVCTTPDNKTGRCIRVMECKHILNVLRKTPKPYPAHIVEALNQYKCTTSGNYVAVCCPNSPITISDATEYQGSISSPSSTSSASADVSNHPNFNLLPTECGKAGSEDKISRGQDADLLEFPWMALISHRTGTGPQFKCGGSIINNRYILTAAHCIKNEPLLGVRIGEYDIRKSVDCQVQHRRTKCTKPVQDLRIEKVVVHANYDPKTFSNDIGLLRLEEMDLEAENAKAICLPTNEETRKAAFNNVVVTGWGITDSAGTPTTVLQKVELPVITKSKCQAAYSSDKRIKIRDNQICAGGVDMKVSCPGDSGGPLQVPGAINDDIRMVQHGIVSFGHRTCGQEGFPGVYTKVVDYLDWILDNIEP